MRNIHRAGYILKTQANPGYLNLVELKSFQIEKIEDLVKNCSICINLIGILHERKKNQFKTIHTDFPDMLSKIASKYNIEKFIHLSSLAVENIKDSDYALSKAEGEKKIKNNFKKSIIIKPSIVYSVDDKFSTKFMTLISRLPVIPLYYNGNTKFRPIHVTDLVNIIFSILESNNQNLTLECIGPETLSFKDILKNLLLSIKKKRVLLPLPLPIASLTAKMLQILPNPLLTEDQLKLLKYDNIATGFHKTNYDLNLQAKKTFKTEIDKYSYNWRTGGQFNKINDIN